MAKILATEIRAGNLLEWDKRLWRVLKSYHVHVGGRGGAYMQIEIKDIESGQKRNERLATDEKIERPFIDSRQMTYSYQDGDNYVFMDNETFEQHSLPLETCAESLRFIKEGSPCQLLYWNDRLIDFTPPQHVILEVTYTEPAVRGNTSSNVTKAATLETGAETQVPAFVATGDKIKLDALTGEYIERVRD